MNHHDSGVIFVSSLSPVSANHRMWFTALPKATRISGAITASIRPEQLSGLIRLHRLERIAIIALYWDQNSLREIQNVKKQLNHNLVVGIICSDVNALGEYVRWADTADFFVAPTREHKHIIKCFLDNDVIVIQEPVDPIAADTYSFEKDFDGWLTWFGYVENFQKGMGMLLPAIEKCVSEGHIKGLRVVTNAALGSGSPDWIKATQFTIGGVCDILSTSKYTILSHFPYDLQLNSLIKTDNKAVLALRCGSIPIVSDTPSYRRLMTELNLENMIYSGPGSLALAIRNIIDRGYCLSSRHQNLVREMIKRRSIEATAKRLASVVEKYLGR